MPSGEKPYRVYRGGRARGKVPKAQKPTSRGGAQRSVDLRPNRRWLRWIPAALGIFVVFLVVWGLASYFQFRNGVSDANKRLAGGCHLTRTIANDIEHAGFGIDHLDNYYAKGAPKPWGYTFEGRALKN